MTAWIIMVAVVGAGIVLVEWLIRREQDRS
jgi:hypothetical protein